MLSFYFYTATSLYIQSIIYHSKHNSLRLQALGIPECTMNFVNLGSVPWRAWWWLKGVETCSPEVTFYILYNKLLCFDRYFILCMYQISGPGSSVGIATELRAGRSGDRIPVGARFSAPIQTGPGAHPASCTMGTGFFPGVKYGRGVTLTIHPLVVPTSWKSRAIPLPTLWATPGL
jgi:hypothetical protein